MESDDKDNESVLPDNANGVIWEVRNPQDTRGNHKERPELQSPHEIAVDRKKTIERCHVSSVTNAEQRVTIDY